MLTGAIVLAAGGAVAWLLDPEGNALLVLVLVR